MRVLVLDVCRNNPFGRNWRASVRSTTNCLATLELDPQNTFALSTRSAVFRDMSEEWKAQPDFDRLIAITPTTSLDFVALGDAHHAKKDFDLAISYYTKAIELNPKFAVAYTDRGLVDRPTDDLRLEHEPGHW